HALVELVQAPAQRRQPGKAALNEDDLKPWEALKHALDDQAGHGGLAGSRMPAALLDIIGRPAGTGVGMTAGTEYMQADRKGVAHGGFIDRPVALVAGRFATAAQPEDLRQGGRLRTA